MRRVKSHHSEMKQCHPGHMQAKGRAETRAQSMGYLAPGMLELPVVLEFTVVQALWCHVTVASSVGFGILVWPTTPTTPPLWAYLTGPSVQAAERMSYTRRRLTKLPMAQNLLFQGSLVHLAPCKTSALSSSQIISQ